MIPDLRIGGCTAVFGIVGDPIEHTLSPAMHNAALASMGYDGAYVPFRVNAEHLEAAVRGITALGIRGLNVTVPHKTAVLPFCDRLTEVASAVGAVNTLINDGDVLTGDNTDAAGFVESVIADGGLERFPERVCVLGAGGSARAVVYACVRRSEVREVFVINRTLARAEKLAADLAAYGEGRIVPLPALTETVREYVPASGLVVNATSMGMHPHEDATPLPETGILHGGQVVVDIIYAPLVTRLLRDAGKRGAQTINGLGMLARQGARSLALWTGRDVPANVMLDTLRRLLEHPQD